MNIAPLCRGDIARFLKLAAGENWIAEPWEFEFLLKTFPEGCFAARDESGDTAGFVTALRHERSGWIGNLIVDRRCRGKGVGETLFVMALNALRSSAVETVWLTASNMGKALYVKHGFRPIDTIVRWSGKGRGVSPDHGFSDESLEYEIDRLGWGDRREALLKVIRERGNLLAADDMIAIIQTCGHAVQVGPFGSVDPLRASLLLDAALGKIPLGVKVYIDAPEANPVAAKVLRQRGFRNQGSNELMYAGIRPAYRPEFIYGLASMGSMG